MEPQFETVRDIQIGTFPSSTPTTPRAIVTLLKTSSNSFPDKPLSDLKKKFTNVRVGTRTGQQAVKRESEKRLRFNAEVAKVKPKQNEETQDQEKIRIRNTVILSAARVTGVELVKLGKQVKFSKLQQFISRLYNFTNTNEMSEILHDHSLFSLSDWSRVKERLQVPGNSYGKEKN